MIVTFYSYKGGVGRSMALANVASLLARRGLRVLMIDFDLEAPGLEQFFPINQPGILRAPGLLDLLLAYKQNMSLAADDDDAEPSFMRLKETFLQPVYKSLDAGKLDLLHAGQREGADQLASYAYNLRNFDWQDFYFNWAGEAFFEWLRQALVPKLYDVALVDSRTGVTEMGGICAYQLADAIVMFCAANHQNVQGTLNVVGNFFSPAVQARRQNRPLQVLVVPSRIEQRDGHLLQDFRERFESRFAQYVPPSLQQAGQGFWDLLIPYESSYAFEERVVEQRAAVEEASNDEPPPITAAFERLAQAIARLAGPETALGRTAAGPEAASEAQTEPLRDLTRSFAGYDAYLSHHSADKEVVERIAQLLRAEGVRLFLDAWEIVPGESWRVRSEEALFQSRVFVVLLGTGGAGPWQSREIKAALARQDTDPEFRVIPVLLPGALLEAVPIRLLNLLWVDFREGIDPQAFSRLLAGIRKVAPGPAAESAVVTGSPYRGLEPFREQDAKFYVGREPVVRDLIDKLREGARLLGISGPSGSGKTSLVQGGLFPALRGGALPGSELWSLVALRCGGDPPEKLAAALRPERDTLLFLDDFEKLFSLFNPEERRAFLDRLLTAAEIKDGPLRVVIAIREDFLGACLSEPSLAKALESNRIRVRPLAREDLRKTIEEPAQRAGVAFEVGLVERILDDLADVPGALPLLQTLLQRLWQRQQRGFLTASAYDEMGGVRGVITYQAEDVYARLYPEQQEIAQRILLRLVHTGEGAGDTSRRATLSELRALHEVPSSVEKVLNALVSAGLVIVSGIRDEASAELAHDVLLRSWPRLQQWAEKNRQFLLWRDRLRADVLNWQKYQRDPGYLLRGAALATAEEFLRNREADLAADELEFLAVSQEQERSRRRRRWWERAGMAAGILGGLLLSWMTFRAEQGGKTTLSRKLAADSSIVLEKDPSLALLLGVEALRTDDTLEARQSLLAALDYGAFPREPLRSPDRGIVESVALSPDGTLLASGSDEGYLVLWDVAKHQQLRVFPSPFSEEVDALAFSPDGRRFASGLERQIYLWHVSDLKAKASPRPIRLEGHSRQVESMAFSPDSRLLASSADDGQIFLWDAITGEQLRKIGSHGKEVEVDSVAFSPDGQRVASGSEDKTIKLWSIEGGEPLFTFKGHTAGVDALAFSPDGKLLASGSDDKKIILWDMATRRVVWSLPGHTGGIKSLAFTPDGEVLISGSEDQRILFWSVPTGARLSRPLTSHEGSVESISLNRNGTLMASGGADRQVLLWDMAPRPFLGRREKAAQEAISSVAFSPPGKLLATGIENQYRAKIPGLLVWDLAASRLVGRPLAGHSTPTVFRVAFDPKSGSLASGDADGSILLWDTTTGQGRKLPRQQGGPVLALAFSLDGKRLASGGTDRDVVLLDLESMNREELKGHVGPINALAFSPDGRLLASGSEDKKVLLWDLATAKSRPLLTEEAPISSLSFSPDGETLALGSEKKLVLVNVRDGKHLFRFSLPTPIAGVAFNQDGKILASGGEDGVDLWDVTSGQRLHPLSGHAVRSVAFSPDGKLLASAGNDGSFILWETSPDTWIARACKAAQRKKMTAEEWKMYLADQSRRTTC